MNPKKDLLFIMNNLQAGGAEKALVSLLQIIDYSRYNVDLLLLKKEGVFLDKVPKEVTLLNTLNSYAYFDMPLVSAVFQTIKKAKFTTLLNRILSISVLKTERNPAVKEQKMWKFLSPCLNKIPKKYDCAIGFLEKTPNYFCIDKVTADRKLLWIHTNYSSMGMDPKYDIPYFKKADCIVTISDDCAADLQNVFPQFSDKIKVVQNIVSPTIIRTLAENEIPENLNFNNSIITVGRLSHEKGIDLAIEACKILYQKKIDFNWFFIGNGPQRNELELKVIEYHLQNKVVFLGEKANPYPYVKKALIYAQTSRFEGKSIALDEAKILQKPILATNFSTVSTQITHLENGHITAINAEAIADGIENLLSDLNLQQKFQSNLAAEKLGTESEIEHFYQLIH